MLRHYKLHNGAVDYPSVMAVPTAQRLPAMAQENYEETLSLVATALGLTFEALNITRPPKSSQVVDLAETILDSATEDNLAFEDLMLFLQQLTRGEYGQVYESMDTLKFMAFFEKYREERFQAKQNINEEQAAQHSAVPINERLIDAFNEQKSKHRDALKDYFRTIHLDDEKL